MHSPQALDKVLDILYVQIFIQLLVKNDQKCWRWLATFIF